MTGPRVLTKDKKEKIKKWLMKDRTLTNSQLRELLGIGDRLILEVRRELNLPCPTMAPTHQQVDTAFKSYMTAIGRPIKQSPWRQM